MARSQSPGALIGKWLVVPILVALFGYYVVGPRFGNHKRKVEEVQTDNVAAAAAATTTNTEHAEAPIHKKVAHNKVSTPELDISVEKVGQTSTVAESDSNPPRRKRHRKPAQSEDLPIAKDPSENQPDEGGSGGVTSAG